MPSINDRSGRRAKTGSTERVSGADFAMDIEAQLIATKEFVGSPYAHSGKNQRRSARWYVPRTSASQRGLSGWFCLLQIASCVARVVFGSRRHRFCPLDVTEFKRLHPETVPESPRNLCGTMKAALVGAPIQFPRPVFGRQRLSVRRCRLGTQSRSAGGGRARAMMIQASSPTH